jgi:hypothetical protein
MTTLQEAYSVANENGEVIIRLNRAAFDNRRITEILNLIVFDAIKQKSKLTEEQVESLSKEINKNVWETAKKRFVEG